MYLPSSPPHRHKSRSSVDHTTSLGSSHSYATPSPRRPLTVAVQPSHQRQPSYRAPPFQTETIHSEPVDTSNPSAIRSLSHQIPEISRIPDTKKSGRGTLLDLPDLDRHRLNSSHLSERGNWLSDSECSEQSTFSAAGERPQDKNIKGWIGLAGGGQSDAASQTPTLGSFIEARTNLTHSQSRHRVRDSTATLTQDDFWNYSPSQIALQYTSQYTSNASMPGPDSSSDMTTLHSKVDVKSEREKPLPPRPLSREERSEISYDSPKPTLRPQVSSLHSFQRPRKRVIWKGKSCIIAFPLDDDRGSSTGIQLLTPADVEARLRQWETEGYETKGFILSNSLENPTSRDVGGQSRHIFPEQSDVLEERQRNHYRVSIPDQAEWQAWMEYVKEEKLRALGVTTSESDPPRSLRSPLSSSLSRASSQHPSLPISPPRPPSSVVSNQVLQNAHLFSPHFNPSTGVQAPSVASSASQELGPTEGTNRYKPSVAYPVMEARMTSPFNYPAPHPTPPKPSDHSTLPYYAQRQGSVSPATVGAMQSLGEVLSPVSPLQVETSGIAPQPGMMLERMRQQHQELQAQMFRQQQQQIVLNQPRPGDALSVLSSKEMPSRISVEIAHPTPRGHQRNFSEALQREIDEAESILEESYNAQERSSRDLQTSVPEAATVGAKSSRFDLDKAVTDDHSSLETNSSVSGARMDRITPWMNRTDLSQDPPNLGSEHKPRPPTSKLNVKAKEFKFDPKAAFAGSNFVFGSNTFQPAPRSQNLNATAPDFKPSKTPALPSSSEFKFGTATFNVEAPVFSPSAFTGQRFSSASISASDDQSNPASKIFSNINIDTALKTTRRSSKPLLIVNPEAHDSDVEERDRVEDDEDGRPAPSLARSKRARRGESDGDRVPMYAASAPFEPNIEPSSAADPGEASVKIEAPAEASEEALVSNIYERPTSSPPQEYPLDDAATEWSQLPRHVGHQLEPSMSALAGSFEPRQGDHRSTSTDNSTSTPPEARKFLGLEASRFAGTPTLTPLVEPVPHSSASASLSELLSEIERTEERLSLTDNYAPEKVGQTYSSRSSSFSVDEELTALSEVEQVSVRSNINFPAASHTSRHIGDQVPSYEEIDAVMRQFEDNPDLGVERLDTPPLQSSPAPGLQLRPKTNLRSDAPSPSPRRAQAQRYVPHESTEIEMHSLVHPVGLGIQAPVQKLSQQQDLEVSDWNNALSSPEANKFRNRASFFDGHVNDLVDTLLEKRLGPLERSLEGIQNSIASISTPQGGRHERRSVSADVRESDADDEDDYDDFDGGTSYRTRSPATRRDRKPDKIKAAVLEALATHNSQGIESSILDLSALPKILTEMRVLAEHSMPENRQAELKAVVEEVVATHPRLRGHRVQQSHDSSGIDEKYRLQISGLETMLKVANERAEDESRSRRDAEDELADTLRQLRYAEEEAAQYRESSEEAERSLSAYHKEKESIETLEDTISELSLKNAALETTLEEYRLSSDQWRDEIKERNLKNKELRQTLHSLKRHLEDSTESKQALRAKVERLQEDIAHTVRDIASDQASWRHREHDLLSKTQILQNILEHEVRRREKVELELDELDKEHKGNGVLRERCTRFEDEVSTLEKLVAVLRKESKGHEDSALRFERELEHARESAEVQISQGRSALEVELNFVNSQNIISRNDLEAQVMRLRHQLENAELDATETRAKHNALLEETMDTHSRALHQAAEDKDAELQVQHSAHEKKLNDLRERHTRALHNSSDDRHRLEHHLTEKLTLSDDKVQHLETKVADLEERLDITKSAARAAVEAANFKGGSLPTPAPSVVASPPHLSTASMPIVRGTDIPEKISPQALRESIMVLQDQLQNREQIIERLEAELAHVDNEAPAKIKNRDTEISWLRELLGVRVDDLQEIITTLSKPNYDQDAVRDAAIRLRTTLQMEQQEKERAAGGASNILPSIASLSSLTQSPRALPMAAAAAWGNWRKARDSSLGALSDLANLGSQTPSRSTVAGGPQSFLAGLITPPGANQRQSPPIPGVATAPPTMMSLGAGGRKMSGDARPLRAYNAQARSLSARSMGKQAIPTQSQHARQQHSHPEPPSTPPMLQGQRFDQDADTRSLGDDVDEDAASMGSKEYIGSGEPFGGEEEEN